MTRRTRIFIVGAVILLAMASVVALVSPVRNFAAARLAGNRTVSDVVDQYGAAARNRMAPAFKETGVEYPPKRLTLAAIKSERRLEVWSHESDGPRLVMTYPILGASGVAGPKLKEGDRQVPEGVYRIEGLNPNSSLHLSMKLDYPNALDRKHAESEGRTNLGGNIFIHGEDTSVGCLAMGDPAIEELFVMVDDVGRDNVTVVIAPVDPRKGRAPIASGQPDWLPELYDVIWAEFRSLAASGTS